MAYSATQTATTQITTHRTRGYWKTPLSDFNKLKLALEPHIRANKGCMPSRSFLLEHDASDIESAIRSRHGGYAKTRERLGIPEKPLEPIRSPYANKEFAIRTLEIVKRAVKRTPTSTDFKKITGTSTAYIKIDEYHNISKLYEELGWKRSKPKYHVSKLRDQKLFVPRMEKVIDILGRFPTDDDLGRLHYNDLRVVIRYMGGYRKIQYLFKQHVNLFPSPWKDPTFVAIKLFELKEKYGKWLKTTDLRDNKHWQILNAIYKYHGNFEQLLDKAKAQYSLFERLAINDFLALKARAGDLEAREYLIIKNEGLIIKAMRACMGRGVEYEDLLSAGRMGLLRAIKSYDPEKGAFNTYAYFWIQQYTSRELADTSRLVRLPTHIFSRTKTTEKKISFDSEIAPDSETTLLEIFPGEKDVNLKSFENELLFKKIRKIIATLKQRERRVITLRYGLDLRKPRMRTYREVGAILGLSHESIRLIEKEAMIELKVNKMKDPKYKSLIEGIIHP
jgi:RNA polymerase sigma factor (sigma-70 family)